jgi:NAD(P)-dependent dehydrogenase (short-subunit alcohol dehydrogenase family)
MSLLKGKIALVTGAGDGIGRGIALAFAREGADVVVCARRAENVRETARLVEAIGSNAHWGAFDIRDEPAIAKLCAEAENKLGPVSVLVNNAAVMPVVDVVDMTMEQFDQCVDAKFKSAVFMSKHCIPQMRRAGGGSIIHMASVTGNVGFAKHAVYGACNSALIGLARGQAMELAPLNIRVNSVSPGTVDSPMLTRYIADSGEDPVALRASFDKNHPRGKVASVDDVANAFIFLASDLSANITAQDLRCDGGFSFKGGQAAA